MYSGDLSLSLPSLSFTIWRNFVCCVFVLFFVLQLYFFSSFFSLFQFKEYRNSNNNNNNTQEKQIKATTSSRQGVARCRGGKNVFENFENSFSTQNFAHAFCLLRFLAHNEMFWLFSGCLENRRQLEIVGTSNSSPLSLSLCFSRLFAGFVVWQVECTFWHTWECGSVCVCVFIVIRLPLSTYRLSVVAYPVWRCWCWLCVYSWSWQPLSVATRQCTITTTRATTPAEDVALSFPLY